MSLFKIQEVDFVDTGLTLISNKSYNVQYDLFKSPEESETEALLKEISSVKVSNDKVRKKLFAENGSLKLRMLQLEERLQVLESNICKGRG